MIRRMMVRVLPPKVSVIGNRLNVYRISQYAGVVRIGDRLDHYTVT